MTARILVVDNYDSFVFNLVQYLYQLGATCEVRRNDAVTVDEVAELAAVLLDRPVATALVGPYAHTDDVPVEVVDGRSASSAPR